MKPVNANLLPIVIALFVSGFYLGFAPARAVELPEDTNKIESLTVEQARRLARKPGKVLLLNGLTTLDADTAKALTEFKGESLGLDGLKGLSAEAAKALAQHRGEQLSLGGLTALSAEAAKALGEHKGQQLCLDSLTTLSAEAIQALGLHQGSVSINALLRNEVVARHPLSPQTAKALVLFLQGDLSGITALDSPDSVAIAKALAATTRPLSLPNLKKISPKTLTALIEKRDVEIPLIETLEIIAEPDGSATEDFVIPEWLEARQKERAR